MYNSIYIKKSNNNQILSIIHQVNNKNQFSKIFQFAQIRDQFSIPEIVNSW
jgi:hypothetical protein